MIRSDAGRMVRRCFDDVVLKETENQFDVIQRGDLRQNGDAPMRIVEMKILFDGTLNLSRTRISFQTENENENVWRTNDDQRITFADSILC